MAYDIISSYTLGKAGGEVVYTLAKTALVGFMRAYTLEWASYNVKIEFTVRGMLSKYH